MPPHLKLIVEKLDIPWGCSLPFTGDLYVGRPSRNKPKQTSPAAWCSEVLSLAAEHAKAYLVIPDSFWPEASGNQCVADLIGCKPPHFLRLPDLLDGFANAETPLDTVREIVEHLKDADDVLILSSSKTTSGFVPAILSMLADPSCHIVKVLWPIENGRGYALTPAQRGYLAGLYDAAALHGLGLESSPRSADGWAEKLDEQPLPELSKESIEALRKDICWTTEKLCSFGGELFHEITGELMDITNFLCECERHPGVNITLGGMASISYRLCDVFKETATIGLGAIKAVEEHEGLLPPPDLQSSLADLRREHGVIAERLAHLYDSLAAYIPCDLRVLEGHPEIARHPALQQTIKLIDDQVEELVARLDEIRHAALDISQAVLTEPAPPKKDRDWKTMQTMLAQCVETCMEKARAERTPWSDTPTDHPKHGETGEIVRIKHPTKPSSASAWQDARRSAVFVPGGKAPKAMNGVAIRAWRDHPRTPEDWNACDLLMPDLAEPAPPKSSLPLASGVAAVEPDGRIWMVSPTNKFGGYETTFPKGKLDHGKLTLQANAVKEGYEESGLKVRITGYLGDFKRTTSITRLYLAERVGGDPTDMGWESQAVRLVPRSEWASCLQNPSDKPVLTALLKRFGD